MEKISDRILMIMKYYDLNTREMTEKCKLKTNTILTKLLKSTTVSPSYETIVKILDAFPKVSATWFVLGKGSMFGDTGHFLPNASDRIAYLINRKGLNIRTFSHKVNVAEEALSDIIQNKKQPDQVVLSRIASAFQDVDPSWLFLNEGEVFRSESEGSQDTE